MWPKTAHRGMDDSKGMCSAEGFSLHISRLENAVELQKKGETVIFPS